jgi:hypothetical protein
MPIGFSFVPDEGAMKQLTIILMLMLLPTLACGGTAAAATPTAEPSRLDSIPATAHKMTPAEDAWPPIATEGLSKPQPLPAPINTAGAEDSPFLTLDGGTLYFFFTPDLNIPVEKQLFDGVTGIWATRRSGDTWTEPKRVHLSDPGKLALDGCEFASGNLMYFCTVREGYTGIQWFRAELKDGNWQDWHFAGDELKQSEYEVGELHITADGQELYFGSPRAGGYGGLDLWVSRMTPNGWSKPVNLGPQINTAGDEGWPYVSPDGKMLWYDGISRKGLPGPAIFRSIHQVNGTWSQPEEMVSQFAGEPTLSADGHTLYFVHHYFSSDLKHMIEADVYSVIVP